MFYLWDPSNINLPEVMLQNSGNKEIIFEDQTGRTNSTLGLPYKSKLSG